MIDAINERAITRLSVPERTPVLPEYDYEPYARANVLGKPRAFPLYLGGFNNYVVDRSEEVAANRYEGFILSPAERG